VETLCNASPSRTCGGCRGPSQWDRGCLPKRNCARVSPMRLDSVRSSGMLGAAGLMALLVLVSAELLARPCGMPGMWIGAERTCCAPDCCPAQRATRVCCLLELGQNASSWGIHSPRDGSPPEIQGPSVLVSIPWLAASRLGETGVRTYQPSHALYLRSCSLLL